jgi:hypothetical protein
MAGKQLAVSKKINQTQRALNIARLEQILILIAVFSLPVPGAGQAVPGQTSSCVAREQQSGIWRIEIGPSASVRCPAFGLAAGEGVRLFTDSRSGLNLDVYVYNVVTRELVAKSDDEAAEPFYEWKAIEQGNYYVIVRNNSEQGGSAELRVNSAEGTKDLGPVVPPNAAVVNVYLRDRSSRSRAEQQRRYVWNGTRSTRFR